MQLTMTGVPGLVYTVAPNSVTFPDGTHVGRLSISQVHSDRVPMVPANGTTPQGITNEEAASRWVRGMFGQIAGNYDLLNHLLSFNFDKRWRARAVDHVATVLQKPNTRALDLCCGTGDVLLSLEAQNKKQGE